MQYSLKQAFVIKLEKTPETIQLTVAIEAQGKQFLVLLDTTVANSFLSSTLINQINQ